MRGAPCCGWQGCVHLGKRILKATFAGAEVVLSGVVGAIGEPQAEQGGAGGVVEVDRDARNARLPRLGGRVLRVVLGPGDRVIDDARDAAVVDDAGAGSDPSVRGFFLVRFQSLIPLMFTNPCC